MFFKYIKNKISKLDVMVISVLSTLLVIYFESIKRFIFGLIFFSHFIFPPVDLFEPIVFDDFNFTKKGYSKQYDLNYKYFDNYMIEITSKEKYIGRVLAEEAPNKDGINKLYGKIKIDYYSNKKILKTNYITTHSGGAYSTTSASYFSTIVLDSFYLPFEQKYYNNLSVRVTVIEPVQKLLSNELIVRIGCSPHK